MCYFYVAHDHALSDWYKETWTEYEGLKEKQ